MRTSGNRVLEAGIVSGLCLGAIVGFTGCEQGSTGEVETEVAALASENGLSLNGLSLNGLSLNGLSLNGLSLNGLSLNGLTTTNGLSSTSGLMTTSGGRDAVKYIVKCAFPAGMNLVKSDQNGVHYTFPGALGVAPELNSSTPGVCGVDCQERVSACMLAHVNNAGVHIQLWLDSEGAIGWGQNAAYPYQEGSFFGNLFPSPWKGYYCNGKDYDTGSVPGRLGAPLTSSVYVDPYGGNVECGSSGQCTGHTTDGYDQCRTSDGKAWNHVVTVWRNFDATTQYKICQYGSGKCLGVVAGSTADGAQVEIRGFTGAAGQSWSIVQVSPGKYKVINVTSGKALDQDALSPRHAIQKTYTGAPTQLIAIKSLSFASQFGRYNLIPSTTTTTGLDAIGSDGAIVQLDTNLMMDSAKWTVVPVQ